MTNSYITTRSSKKQADRNISGKRMYKAIHRTPCPKCDFRMRVIDLPPMWVDGEEVICFHMECTNCDEAWLTKELSAKQKALSAKVRGPNNFGATMQPVLTVAKFMAGL